MPLDAPLVEGDEANCKLLPIARKRWGGQLSQSVYRWLALVGQTSVSNTVHIRDIPVFEPIEDHLNDPTAKDATVILISGESDMFWAVPNSRLSEEDPPVDVFQTFEPSIPALLGRDTCVSEFALKYLCLYNDYAVRNREWFSANGTEEDIQAARKWFDHALVFDSDDGWCGHLEILESRDAAAIALSKRLHVSLFRDPDELKLPPFLQSEMERHLEVRRRYA